ncbi:MAG: flagellar biosynthetic protein FliR, partial [Isosphaeraceae bacterium]
LGLCLTAPGLAVPGLDWRFRLGLAVVLGSVLVPVVGMEAVPPANLPGVLWEGFAEIVTGGLMGLTAGLIVAGARSAGELVSAQAGLSTSTLFDPDSGEELTAMGRLYGWIAMAAFLAMDGPLVLMRATAESYTVIPAGQLLITPESAKQVFGQVGHALELALRAAAPLAIAMVMAGIVLGWLSRTAPSLPFLALSLPIRAGLGIVLVLLGLVVLMATLSSAWNAALPVR